MTAGYFPIGTGVLVAGEVFTYERAILEPLRADVLVTLASDVLTKQPAQAGIELLELAIDHPDGPQPLPGARAGRFADFAGFVPELAAGRTLYVKIRNRTDRALWVNVGIIEEERPS